MRLPANLDQIILDCCAAIVGTNWTTSPDAPATYKDVCASYKRTGIVIVWDGGSDDTIYGSPEVNYAFRAWHDWCHIHGGFKFTIEGETAVCEMQCRHVIQLLGDTQEARDVCNVLRAEIIAMVAYYKQTGKFVENQKDFVLEILSRA